MKRELRQCESEQTYTMTVAYIWPKGRAVRLVFRCLYSKKVGGFRQVPRLLISLTVLSLPVL